VFTKEFLAEWKLLSVWFFASELAGHFPANPKGLSLLKIRDPSHPAMSPTAVLLT
jgi:hypothetical protein